jgi:hypothetical protein
MQKKSLTAMVRHHLDHARDAPAGRSDETVWGGHEYVLRQTVIALGAGQRLDDHDNLDEAIVQVLEDLMPAGIQRRILIWMARRSADRPASQALPQSARRLGDLAYGGEAHRPSGLIHNRVPMVWASLGMRGG